MSDETASYFGIDLGTTYSAIAYVDETGRPTVVRNQLTSEETLPSVVYFESASNVVVGQTAKEVAKVYPDRVVSLVKRQMGQEREWDFDGTTHTPESISALVLKQLAQDARAFTGQDVRQVVITVPAYFGMLERDATKNAGRIAGLDVIGIVPEPVAAALHYDVVSDAAGKTILVYDLGGGTFDTTVISIEPDAIEVLCTDGDQQLGGADWDARLMSLLLDEFTAQAAPEESPEEDERFMQDLAMVAEDTKRQLSQVQSRTVPLRFGGAAAMVAVTREAFEERTRDLLDSTIEYTRRTLATLDTKRPGARIDEVLLVGGSTKMPMVAERLGKEFGWEPRLHDPDLAVAKGAARFALGRAMWKWDGGEPADGADREQRIAEVSVSTGIASDTLKAIADKKITNVLPKSFGVKLVDIDNPAWERDPEAASYVDHLVHANESLPSGPRPLPVATLKANQRAVRIQVYEQAGSVETSELSGNKPVDHGSGEVGPLPRLPAGSPVDVTMTVDDEGLLQVHAVEPTSGATVDIAVRVSVLSEEEVREAQDQVSGITVRT
jgi:molecular chaperone DnaK